MGRVIQASAEIRAARQQAHLSFDRLWRYGSYTRAEAYAWLALQLDVAEEDAHMGVMTHLDTLHKVVQVCDLEYGSSVAEEDFPDDL